MVWAVAVKDKKGNENQEWGEFWNPRHGPSMYSAALFGAHCAGLESCTGNP
jgi:hypothetical protein